MPTAGGDPVVRMKMFNQVTHTIIRNWFLFER